MTFVDCAVNRQMYYVLYALNTMFTPLSETWRIMSLISIMVIDAHIIILVISL